MRNSCRRSITRKTHLAVGSKCPLPTSLLVRHSASSNEQSTYDSSSGHQHFPCQASRIDSKVWGTNRCSHIDSVLRTVRRPGCVKSELALPYALP